MDFFDTITPMAGLTMRATEIAIELNHAAYDCFYLAEAERAQDFVVTADEKMLAKLIGTSLAALALPLREAAAL
jgi:predicted nucleic acid-binding protein